MLGLRPVATYKLEFYEDDRGDKPALRWIREELTRTQRAALGRAMREVLQERAIGVCGTEFGRQLGKGLFEFRLRLAAQGAEATRILLRVFCHAYGDRVVLLLGGYDKGADPSPAAGRTPRSRSRGAAWRVGGASGVDG